MRRGREAAWLAAASPQCAGPAAAPTARRPGAFLSALPSRGGQGGRPGTPVWSPSSPAPATSHLQTRGVSPARGPPAAFQTPQTHPGGACRACAGWPLPANVLCPPSSPRSDGHCGQTPLPLWAPSTPFLPPSQHQPLHVPLAMRGQGQRGGRVLPEDPAKAESSPAPSAGREGPAEGSGQGCDGTFQHAHSEAATRSQTQAPLTDLTAAHPPSLQRPSHTASGLQLRSRSGLSPGFSPGKRASTCRFLSPPCLEARGTCRADPSSAPPAHWRSQGQIG